MQEAWASDPDTRFRAAAGGVLTALAAHLLRSSEARFILHCAAGPQAPMRSVWCLSDTPSQLLQRAGSRYSPSDTLAGLQAALDRDEPFAVIAKPCDAGALREVAKTDQRLARNLVAVLDDCKLSETYVALSRYRGHGNPGPTRIETRDGRAFQKTHVEM
ncbi:coenzyme F420 hydrogenase/dehydrogenase beta subunit N-terminal domain-containing protein [Leisingera sp. ANG-M7]|uniref:coenzyme F420 hydrogenase/dehydrogenase beta subunit N-terminal domain-containing protein n=1 Tax=Leisingera sp. ANG-M7 TaxID=1577902 RepID=UPI00057E3097|nr:coenzyme F420 hydrogenase/dehydrogenase beta subunit N-terminal domain-containing protein [Leisingera sp. ANG-M7]KIC35603.1 hypothetical protein RA26_17835 [Leisingera sp. ANG-M7]